MASTVRSPAVAGQFYPDDAQTLLPLLRTYLGAKLKSLPAFGCIVPHAGYIYSGHVAGAVFAELALPACFVILCPNHTGRGMPFSIMSQGTWETPLGPAQIDSLLAEALKREASFLSEDFEAHRYEHAIEVELPFLLTLRPELTFVPIALGTRQFETLETLGRVLATVIADQNRKILVIASGDMNHYESDAITRMKDHKAIERILALDVRGLFDVVQREQISMCGLGPTVVLLTAAKQSGVSHVELVKYATSGDVSGDRDKVVGYAGVVMR